MVDLKTLGIIGERLREIFLDNNMLPFAGETKQPDDPRQEPF
jgi:hypothetical protein